MMLMSFVCLSVQLQVLLLSRRCALDTRRSLSYDRDHGRDYDQPADATPLPQSGRSVASFAIHGHNALRFCNRDRGVGSRIHAESAVVSIVIVPGTISPPRRDSPRARQRK